MREVITLRHCIVRINIKLPIVVLRRFQQNVQVCAGVGLGGETESHRWPTVFVFDGLKGLFIQVVVDVNPFWVASICHAVIANEDDIDYISEVAGLQSRVEIFSKDVNGLQRILLCFSESG